MILMVLGERRRQRQRLLSLVLLLVVRQLRRPGVSNPSVGGVRDLRGLRCLVIGSTIIISIIRIMLCLGISSSILGDIVCLGIFISSNNNRRIRCPRGDGIPSGDRWIGRTRARLDIRMGDGRRVLPMTDADWGIG